MTAVIPGGRLWLGFMRYWWLGHDASIFMLMHCIQQYLCR